MNDAALQSMDPEEVIDLTLQLLLETGHYDARTIRVFGRLPFQQRSIVANRLLLELPAVWFQQVVSRYEQIERLTRAAVAFGEIQ